MAPPCFLAGIESTHTVDRESVNLGPISVAIGITSCQPRGSLGWRQNVRSIVFTFLILTCLPILSSHNCYPRFPA